MIPTPIHVLAGVLRDRRGRLLVCQRPPGKHLAGQWEFPGGKLEAGESPKAALVRELREELDIDVHEARPLCLTRHDYADGAIRLDTWEILAWSGQPRGLDGQAMAWAGLAELSGWNLTAADRPVLDALRLPPVYPITPEPDDDDPDGFLRRCGRLFATGHRLLQLRGKRWPDERLASIARHCRDLAERHGADLLINDRPALAAALGAGLHLPSATLRRWLAGDAGGDAEPWLPRDAGGIRIGASSASGGRSRQARGWLAASCHDADELVLAARLGCDFAVLSPVAATGSHPAATPLGWSGFAALARDSAIPVYALGGLDRDDLDTARGHGARGVAGIHAFWPD